MAKAAALAARAFAAVKRFRVREKSVGVAQEVPAQEVPLTPKKRQGAAKEGSCKNGSKCQGCKRWVRNFVCGRQPPSNLEDAAEFPAIRDTYYALRSEKAKAKAARTTIHAKSARGDTWPN